MNFQFNLIKIQDLAVNRELKGSKWISGDRKFATLCSAKQIFNELWINRFPLSRKKDLIQEQQRYAMLIAVVKNRTLNLCCWTHPVNTFMLFAYARFPLNSFHEEFGSLERKADNKIAPLGSMVANKPLRMICWSLQTTAALMLMNSPKYRLGSCWNVHSFAHCWAFAASSSSQCISCMFWAAGWPGTWPFATVCLR